MAGDREAVGSQCEDAGELAETVYCARAGVVAGSALSGAGTQVETDAGAEAAGARLGGERTAGQWVQLRGVEHGDGDRVDLAALRGELQPTLPEHVAQEAGAELSEGAFCF